jgi:hypothetical protein
MATAGPLRTAVFAGDDSPLTFQRIRETGATMVRINLVWSDIAPRGSRQPASFRPADPADPAYDWGLPDRQVKLAAEYGLQVMFTVTEAPLWAQKDEPHPTNLGPYPIRSWKPDPAKLRSFAHAAATRYGGSFQGLPRVKYWELWNEPNLSQYLSPQLESGKVVSPDVYRAMLNAFSAEVHNVHQDNLVVAGSLSAFSFKTKYGRLGIAPMVFMRRLLCMSAGAKPRPTCSDQVAFDVWSHHPWTSGGPTHHATEKDDVSLGDLPEMRRMLDAAVDFGHLRSRQQIEFWITEFGWDTRPPDPNPETAPIALQARWVAEALHRVWTQGVSVFTWFALWDQTYPASALQGGLFFRHSESLRDATPKPTFSAFRFPFVAYRAHKKVSVWGRTPYGRPGLVAVQQRTASRWLGLGTFKTDRDGIFSGKVPDRAVPKTPTLGLHSSTAGASAYRDLVVSAAPTSYWSLDEQRGPTADDAMNVDDGTFAGKVRFGLPGVLPGHTAIRLDGKTARVKLGPVTNLHSVELWVKSSTFTSGAAFSNRNNVHAYTFLGGNGGLAFSFDDYSIFAAPVTNGRWHYVVYTYDSTSSTGKLYVDGKLQSFGIYPRREGGAEASIGYDRSLDTFFKGQIDEVAVYPYPLTAAQVRSHYLASGRGIPPNIPTGVVRAVERRSGIASLPFSLRLSPDRYVLPFGGGGPGFR